MVKVLEYGAKKYAPDNWKKGLDQKELVESMLRHAFELNAAINEKSTSKEFDWESSLHHMGHIMCNAMFYMYHFNNKSFKNKEDAKV